MAPFSVTNGITPVALPFVEDIGWLLDYGVKVTCGEARSHIVPSDALFCISFGAERFVVL